MEVKKSVGLTFGDIRAGQVFRSRHGGPEYLCIDIDGPMMAVSLSDGTPMDFALDDPVVRVYGCFVEDASAE